MSSRSREWRDVLDEVILTAGERFSAAHPRAARNKKGTEAAREQPGKRASASRGSRGSRRKGSQHEETKRAKLQITPTRSRRSQSRASVAEADGPSIADYVVITDAHIRHIYKLDQPLQKRLSTLGAATWKSGKKIAGFKKLFEESLPPSKTQRPEGGMVGLDNLGATCFANSVIQLLFHDKLFRNAVFSITPDPKNTSTGARLITELQTLFGFLARGFFSSIRPQSLIDFLRINPREQQDLPEFLHLLVSLMFAHFDGIKSPNDDLKQLLSTQREGKMGVSTTCMNCKSVSSREEPFSDLRIHLQSKPEAQKKPMTLEEGLKHTLQTEMLTGSNQYHCSTCDDKQDAEISRSFKSLPATLYIQLMRFTYTMKGTRKKITTPVEFPKHLNLSEYLLHNDDPEMHEYVLTAVAMHRGNSATQGHYFMELNMPKDGAEWTWMQFNDEFIERIPFPTQKATKSGKQLKPSSGCYVSELAYLLVYKRKAEVLREHTISFRGPPAAVMQKVLADNELAQKAADATREDLDNNMAKLTKQCESVVAFAKNFDEGLDDEANLEFVPKSFLTGMFKFQPFEEGTLATETLDKGNDDGQSATKRAKLLSDDANADSHATTNGSTNDPASPGRLAQLPPPPPPPSPPPPKCGPFLLDMSPCLCAHNKVSPLMAPDVRAVNRHALDTFLQQSPSCVIHRLNKPVNGALCRECVEAEVKVNIGAETLKEHKEQFKKLKKKLPRGPPNGAAARPGDPEAAYYIVDVELIAQFERLADASLKISCDNSRVLCCHGNRSCEDKPQRLLSPEAWDLISAYVSNDVVTLKHSAEYCSICLCERHALEQSVQEAKAEAEKEVTELYLLRRTSHPTFLSLQTLLCYSESKPQPFLYILPMKFTLDWRLYAQNPRKHARPAGICTKGLLCPHGKLTVDVATDLDTSWFQPATASKAGVPVDIDFRFVGGQLWQSLLEYYSCDEPIIVQADDQGRFYTSKEVCSKCRDARMQAAIMQSCLYKRTLLSIEKVDVPPLPGENIVQTSQSRRGSRRSQRSQRSAAFRNGKGARVQVSSDTTLRELQVKLINVFFAMPSDMCLYLGDRELGPPTLTLQELMVPAASTLSLFIDPTASHADMHDSQHQHQQELQSVEMGFRGTLLSSQPHSEEGKEKEEVVVKEKQVEKEVVQPQSPTQRAAGTVGDASTKSNAAPHGDWHVVDDDEGSEGVEILDSDGDTVDLASAEGTQQPLVVLSGTQESDGHS